MSRKITTLLAIAFLFECTVLSTGAFAHAGEDGGALHYRSGGRASEGCIPDEGHRRSGDRVGGLSSRFNSPGQRDVWSRWGNYYGPMIHIP